MYILREKPTQVGGRNDGDQNIEDVDARLGLPETEIELDVRICLICLVLGSFCSLKITYRQNLTEFNTAHNRRISMMGIPDEDINSKNRKRKLSNVTFNEDEDVINPEDVDPSVGRF